MNPGANHFHPECSRLSAESAPHLHVDARGVHLRNGAVSDELAESQIERAKGGAAVREHEERQVGDEMLATSQIEREEP